MKTLKSPLIRYLEEHSKKKCVEVKIMEKGFDWKIAGKKFAVNACIVVLSGVLVVYQEDARFLALIPLIKLALNWLKHR